MTRSKVSALLGRLVRRGAVQIVDVEPGRRRYELTERLYNLYHLLRRSGGEGRVRALVDILVHLYEPGQLERDVWPSIVQPPIEAMSELDMAVASRLQRHLEQAGVWEHESPAASVASLPVFESLLESQRAFLGDDDPETMLTRQQIAFCIGARGTNPETVLRLYEDLLRDQERVVGPDHPDTLTSRHQVACYTAAAGRIRTALDLYRQLVPDCERVLGPDHPRTLASRHQLAHFTGQTTTPEGPRPLPAVEHRLRA